LSHRYCYLPVSWKSWNWFEGTVGGVPIIRRANNCIYSIWYLSHRYVRHPQQTQTGSNSTTITAGSCM
jgi:hypothetical protein